MFLKIKGISHDSVSGQKSNSEGLAVLVAILYPKTPSMTIGYAGIIEKWSTLVGKDIRRGLSRSPP